MATFHTIISLRMLFISLSTLTTCHGKAEAQTLISIMSKAAKHHDSLSYDNIFRRPQIPKSQHLSNEDSNAPSTPGRALFSEPNRNRKRSRTRDELMFIPQIKQENDMSSESNAAQADLHKTIVTTDKLNLSQEKNEKKTNFQEKSMFRATTLTQKSHPSKKTQYRPNRTGVSAKTARFDSKGQSSNYLCGPNNTCICIVVHKNIRVNCSYNEFKTFPSLDIFDALAIDVSHNNLSEFSFSTLLVFTRLQRADFTHNQIRQVSVFGDYLVSTSLEELRLNENEMDDINHVPFHVFIHLTHLSLSRNYLTHISNSPFFALESLRFLDLSYNKLVRIDEKAFSSLKRLSTLRLNHNKDLGYVKLSPNLFNNLTSLRVLWMQGNSIKTIDHLYPNKCLGKLSNLRELVIDGLGGGAEIGAEVGQLKYLATLIFGYGGVCLIGDISPTFFSNVQRLRTLIFSDCNLTINSEAFRKLPYLTNYTVEFPAQSYEFCTAFEDLKGLQYTNLKTLALVGFIKGAIKCRSLSLEKTRYLRLLKSLTGLYLDYNYISTIDGDFLENLPKTLEKLSLRGNTFTLGENSWNNLFNFTSLYEIDVREQNLHFSPEEMAYWSSGLSMHDSDEFHIKYLNTGVEDLSVIRSRRCSEKLNSRSKLEERHFSMRNKTNGTDYGRSFENRKCNPQLEHEICLPPNLRYLRASGFTQFGKGLLFNNLSSNRLCYLDFSRSYITNWGDGHLPAAVEVAHLGHNFCNKLNSTFFTENNSLRVLQIQNNYLGPTFSSNRSEPIFSRLKELEHLNIAMNNIFYLPPSFLKGLNNLKHLNMSENKIETVDLDFALTPALRFIDMAKNTISWITRKSRRQLDVIGRSHTLQIDIYLNPLPCTCTGIEFLKWMRDSPVNIVNRKLLQCDTEDRSKVPLTNITTMIHNLEKRCLRNPKLIIITSFSCGLLVIVLISGMLYKHRWKLTYAINTWLLRKCGYRSLDKDTSQRMYDAYVVYCEDDREFALDTMRVEMESKRGHRLCLEDRDFIPGTLNFNNITRAVQDSSRTLLLLSPEFLCNKELQYAILMALMEEYGGQKRREVIFLIRYKQVSDKDMSKDLLMLMKKDRYLDYPSHGDDTTQQSFWDRLSNVIGHAQTIQPTEGL